MAPPDPANLRARVCCEIGLSSELGQEFQREELETSRGGTNAYPHWFCIRKLERQAHQLLNGVNLLLAGMNQCFPNDGKLGQDFIGGAGFDPVGGT